MPICRKCDKTFHRCSGCDTSFDWEYHYCSQLCWISSSEFKRKFKKVRELRKLIPYKKFLEIFQDDYFIDFLIYEPKTYLTNLENVGKAIRMQTKKYNSIKKS